MKYEVIHESIDQIPDDIQLTYKSNINWCTIKRVNNNTYQLIYETPDKEKKATEICISEELMESDSYADVNAVLELINIAKNTLGNNVSITFESSVGDLFIID